MTRSWPAADWEHSPCRNVGAGVGLLIAAAMPTVFAASVGLTTLAIPWAQLAWMLVLSVVVEALAALWPAIRAARLPVLEAVASD